MYSNLPPTPTDTTDFVFVTENVNDALVGFFEKRTGNKETSAALASAVLTGAKQQQIDVMTMIDHLATLTGVQLDSYIALFLNTTRVKTSLLGINNQPIAPYYVARTVLA